MTLACKKYNSNLLRLLLLLMLMIRNVLTTVWCRFGKWSLVLKLSFCSDFEHKIWSDFEDKIWSRFLSWCPGKILKLMFGHYFATDMMLGCGYEVQSWSNPPYPPWHPPWVREGQKWPKCISSSPMPKKSFQRGQKIQPIFSLGMSLEELKHVGGCGLGT